ncbi:cation efflux family protein [Grosmannia clavigera kw1407]|uniref:Cation efflux family protein n=1 Tax=Grosmannia clavigera (strain kw1407 / UAMH 11150) TaxID=655863 RepID=F0XAC4_GROCL|nr:cation efflux family protein [Grosmannia clavigera kw1407]EFX05457.1 cation efflux family protein [Grosmannia clavigera kw1407]
MTVKITPKTRLIATIVISFSFFVAEIAVGFKTRSLALIADAFHYMNDLVGFIVALAALIISERSSSPQDLSFGWQRARLLGAFFNGVFLLALGISIFLQSIERFVALQHVNNPKLVLIMGCVGLSLNIISAAFLHEHSHDHGHEHAHGTEADTELTQFEPAAPQHTEHRHLNMTNEGPDRDLNMLGAFVHVLGDAINNVGVIISAVVIWKASYPARFYADPGVSMGIALMILISAMPLVKHSGTILLQSAPPGVDIDDVKHDLEKIPGIESVHELHIWRLDQQKAIASAHVVVSDQSISSFMDKAHTVTECLHAYGVHSVTLQPELSISSQTSAARAASEDSSTPITGDNSAGILQSFPVSAIRRRRLDHGNCQIPCGALCKNLACCTPP